MIEDKSLLVHFTLVNIKDSLIFSYVDAEKDEKSD